MDGNGKKCQLTVYLPKMAMFTRKPTTLSCVKPQTLPHKLSNILNNRNRNLTGCNSPIILINVSRNIMWLPYVDSALMTCLMHSVGKSTNFDRFVTKWSNDLVLTKWMVVIIYVFNSKTQIAQETHQTVGQTRFLWSWSLWHQMCGKFPHFVTDKQFETMEHGDHMTLSISETEQHRQKSNGQVQMTRTNVTVEMQNKNTVKIASELRNCKQHNKNNNECCKCVTYMLTIYFYFLSQNIT